jgi:hypothetical protein
MNEALQERIENYLDGELDAVESRRFEQDLLTDEVATEFREVLLLRQLLSEIPPEQPPSGLVERIESALNSGPENQPIRLKKMAKNYGFGSLMTALKAGVNWTGYTLSGISVGSQALKGSVMEMQALGYALGPLREPAGRGLQAMRLQPKALWKTCLARAWRGLSA